MNWAALAIGVGVLASTSVLLAARRTNGSWQGRLLAASLLIVACFNGAAPVRGLIDSSYMGYVFGLLAADKGVAVTLLSGAVLGSAVLAAHVAATCRQGPALWIVAAVSAALAIILGAPWAKQLAIAPSANEIQLGEYARISALPATIIVLGVLVLPFVLGAVWASRSALRVAKAA